MPRLKRSEQTILEIPTDDEVLLLFHKASDPQRRSFALVAYAGLRPHEVRALRRRPAQSSGACRSGPTSARIGATASTNDFAGQHRHQILLRGRRPSSGLARPSAPFSELVCCHWNVTPGAG